MSSFKIIDVIFDEEVFHLFYNGEPENKIIQLMMSVDVFNKNKQHILNMVNDPEYDNYSKFSADSGNLLVEKFHMLRDLNVFWKCVYEKD